MFYINDLLEKLMFDELKHWAGTQGICTSTVALFCFLFFFSSLVKEQNISVGLIVLVYRYQETWEGMGGQAGVLQLSSNGGD